MRTRRNVNTYRVGIKINGAPKQGLSWRFSRFILQWWRLCISTPIVCAPGDRLVRIIVKPVLNTRTQAECNTQLCNIAHM